MLQVNSISVFHNEIQALWDITFEVEEKTISALVGSNGAGKTTLLSTIAGILSPKNGEIFFNGVNLKCYEPYQRVELGISLIPEGRHVFPFLTVQENLEIGAYTKRSRAKISESLQWIYGLFPILFERRRQMAGTLSGGEQQMLAIGRGLMSRPQLLMLDEPSLGLAPLIVLKIFEMIQEINRNGLTILLVEQNVQITLRIAKWAYVLELGRIVLQDEGTKLINNDYIKRVYLGL
jgi:branched-chain amino acid transport system ATP-binding protein